MAKVAPSRAVKRTIDSLADVKRALRDTDPDELFDEGTITAAALQAELKTALATELAAFQRDMRTWPKQTDNDRLDAAFQTLERDYGVLARQDYWCCQTCGTAAIADELTATRKKKAGGAIGYTFFHNQDTESAVDGGGLFLAYGGAALTDQSTRAVGRVIVDVLADHKLRPDWDHDVNTRIFVPMTWRRRLPRKSLPRP
jgi:hypothetical protein